MFVIFRQRHLIKRAAHKVQQALPAPTASLPLSLYFPLSLSVPLALNLSHIPLLTPPPSLRLPCRINISILANWRIDGLTRVH